MCVNNINNKNRIGALSLGKAAVWDKASWTYSAELLNCVLVLPV